MVQNGQALTPLERTTLSALNKTLGGMLPALQDGHTEDQAEIDAAVQFISNCNNNFDADAQAAKTAKGEVNTSQKEHAVCRGEQSKLKAEAVKASGELDRFWKSLVLPQKPALASNTLIDNLEQWVSDHKKTLADKLSKTTTTHDSLAKKAAECGPKQSVLENGFCQWFGRATAATKSYARCWTQSGSTFAKLKKEALASAEGRKFQYVAIHKVQCYMKVIFLPSRKSLDTCKNLTLDTSGFNLNNTVAEPQKDIAGELDPMDSKPGDESWKQSVYAGLSGVANVTPCAVAHFCGSDEKVLAHRCVACEPGKTSQAGDDALGPNTSCTAILCSSNEYVSSNACKSCAVGTENAANDDASGADTSCTAILCQAGQRVQNNSCHSCPAGSKNVAGGHDASGADTSCDPIKCGVDHYVQSNACHTCPAGKTRAAGDDATKGDTACDATLCKANQKVVSSKCKGCPPGKTNVAGDDASGANSMCDSTNCTANQRVVSNACIACPDGTTRPAGDDASGKDTTCKPTLCPANYFVVSKACKPCPAGHINAAGDDASGADTTCKPKWRRIFHCEGTSSKNRLDFSKATIKQMAEKATQVKICTKGSSSDCVVSKANSFPIKMLRQGKTTVSHNGDSSCDSQCVKGVWSNTGKVDRLPRLWSTCGKNTEMMFWACNNQHGMHVSIHDGKDCNWFHTRSEHIEMFIDSR
jgi:hypothetical protein